MTQTTMETDTNTNQKQSWNKTGKNAAYNSSNFNKNKAPARRALLMKKGVKWYRQKLSNLRKNSAGDSLSRDDITQLRTEAISLLKTDIFVYEEQKSNSKRDDFEWISNVLQSGTVSDKLAAHTVLIQDSAVHNLRSVENLLRFVNTKGKRECVMAIDNLRDLFVGDLLVPKAKLHTFEELVNSVDPKWLLASNSNSNAYGDRERFLVISHVEDQVRTSYKKFLDQLVAVSHDNLDALKMKSLRTMFDVFINNPEQEKYILSCMINKLGDPAAKVASQTAHLLSQILTEHHPQMKLVIVKEIERLLFRPNITARTEYYCLCFLSQMIFTTGVDQELANTMINVYFTIFNKCIKEGEINNKTMSSLLVGVSRAFPYSKLELSYLEKYMNTFYRILHFVNLDTAIQTLSLIFNLVNFNESGSLTDRFYVTLYRFILNPQIDQCNKTNLLLNIVYRSIKKDPVIKRVRAFIKRLAQVALLSSSAFIIGVLVLISETIKAKEGFKVEANILQNKSQLSNAVSHTTDDKLKANESEAMESGKLEEEDDDDDDDIEVYYDIDEEGEEKPKPNKKDAKESKASWVYVNNRSLEGNSGRQQQQKNGESGGENSNRASKSTEYDIDRRNPLYSNADREEIWELALIGQHFHPTVKLFSGKILANESVEYDGNPLDDFTVKRFLDRFVFRNPKRTVENSKKQTEKPTNMRTRIFGRTQLPKSTVSMGDFAELPEAAVPVDEQFIYQYLRQKKALHLKQKGDVAGDDDSDIESVNSLEFNDLLDNYENYANDGTLEDIDYAKNVQENTKKSKKSKKGKSDEGDDDDADIDDDDADFDEEFDDDDEDMFSGDDDGDVEEIDFGEDDSNEEDDDGDDDDQDVDLGLERGGKKANKARNAAPFAGKKGFGKITNDIFAAAEEFSHILEQNESDSDFELDEDDEDDGKNKKKGNKKTADKGKKRKRPNLGRKAAKRQKPKPRNMDDL